MRRLLKAHADSHDPILRERLVEGYSALVYFLARKFANRGEPLEDVAQVGFVGLIKALDRFDVNRGIEFTTFATPTIVGEIKRYFRDKGWAVRLPRRLQELHLSVLAANEQLAAKLGRQPTVAEIADLLSVSQEDVLEAREISPAQSIVSIDAEGTDGEDTRALADKLGARDEDLERVELRDELEQAMRHLTERERAIVAMRYYDELSQSEIAKRLNISQMHVSRLQRAALEQLRRNLPQEAG